MGLAEKKGPMTKNTLLKGRIKCFVHTFEAGKNKQTKKSQKKKKNTKHDCLLYLMRRLCFQTV